jgi:hypothetical protein
MVNEDMDERYTALRRRAFELAGEPGDIVKRVIVLHQIYQDSRGNHTFPLIALHGALWAKGFFDTGGALSRLISQRYFYDPRERAYRLGLLQSFAENFKIANRQVFIDTYTNYYYTKETEEPIAGSTGLSQELFPRLQRMHALARQGASGNQGQMRDLFESSLLCEQEVTVAPAVKAAVAQFECPILRGLILKPLVRFRYFPRLKYLFFRDFSNKEERIKHAMTSYDLAEKIGWPSVTASMAEYGALPDDFRT